MGDPEANWSFVVNLANSIIGVAVLAFPLCFKQCGVILGLLLLSGCAWLAYTSCYLLAKAAAATKKRSYEYLAFHVFGPSGKLAVELCSAGLLMGTLIAFFVIIGDICPEIISKLFDVQNSTQLRTTVLITLGLLVVLPLCMKSNLESISNLSIMSLVFYSLFTLRVILSSLHHVSTGEFVTDVKYWDFSGVFRSLPIFAVSYACQIQLFLVYHSSPEISIQQIGGLVWRAIFLSSTIYFSVGYFGYVAFYDDEVSGDVMMNYETTFATGLIKLGFVSSTVLSFPLVVYPCRCSLYSLLSSKNLFDNFGGTVHIPSSPFKYLTCFIVALTLLLGVLVPKVEFVLGLMGSTMGSVICFVLPGIIYLRVVTKDTTLNVNVAKAVLFLGLVILVISTWSTLHDVDMKTHLVDLEKDLEKDPQIVNGGGEGGFDLGDNRDPGRPPITAPKLDAKDLAGAIANSSREILHSDLDDGKVKVVHSNLAIDVVDKADDIKNGAKDVDKREKPKDSTQKTQPKEDKKLNSETNKEDIEMKVPQGNDDVQHQHRLQENNNNNDAKEHPLDVKRSPKIPQLEVDGQPEKANMKKLLNLPKLEEDRSPAGENSTSASEVSESQQKSSHSTATLETNERVHQDPTKTTSDAKGVIVETIMSAIDEKKQIKTAKNKTVSKIGVDKL